MRLFYDRPSTPLRAFLLLHAVDVIALLAAALFAAGAQGLEGPGGAGGDLLLLCLWASLPRFLATLYSAAARPSPGHRVHLGAFLIVLATGALLLAGWDLLEPATRSRPGLAPPTAVAVLFAWGSTLLLSHPPAYRLWDFLLTGSVLLCLKDRRPLPVLWLGVFLGAWLASAALRRWIFDIHSRSRASRPNLQNVRVTTLLGLLASAVAFAAMVLPLQLLWPESRGSVASSSRRREALSNPATRRAGSPSTRVPGEADAEPPASVQTAERRAGGVTKVARLSCEVSLEDISAAADDPSEVLRVAFSRAEAADQWREGAYRLWKALSLADYDPVAETWSSDLDGTYRPWTEAEPVFLERPRPPENAALQELRCHVLTSSVRSIIAPYEGLEVRAKAFASVGKSSQGDLFAEPPPSRSRPYAIVAALRLPLDAASIDATRPHPDRRFLAVPATDVCGIDWRELVEERLQGGAGATLETVRAVRDYFRGRFRYSRTTPWAGPGNRLREFFAGAGVGDCTYFSTAAALLLRAAGVSTRLAVGFNEGEWDSSRAELVIRNSHAHAWVEVYLEREGWVPLEPTAWALNARVGGPSQLPPPRGAASAPGDVEDSLRPLSAAEDDSIRPPTARELAGNEAGPEPLSGEPGAPDSFPSPASARPRASWMQYKSGGDPPDALPDREGTSDGPGGGRVGDDDARSARGAEAAARTRGSLIPESLSRALRLGILCIAATAIPLGLSVILRPRRQKRRALAGAAPEEADPAGDIVVSNGDEDVDWEANSPAERVLLEYARLQSDLRPLRAHRLPHQTPAEHAERISRSREPLTAPLTRLARTLYRVLYGGIPVSEEDASKAVRAARGVRRLLG